MSFLQPGAHLEGYRVERTLGSGGFGVTYLVVDEALGKHFALKEYFPTDFAEREAGVTVRAKGGHVDDFLWGKERFIEEARILARFQHRNIVGVARILSANNTAYIVEEYQSGRSLKDWLQGLDDPPTQDELDLLMAPLLDALEAIHGNNVLHRDIAPDNIFVRDDGSPVLLDFGSAKEAVAQRTRTVSSVVKSGYSPVEQYSTTGKGQGPWTDIYALGATLYRAASGGSPDEATERMLSDELKPVVETAKGAYRESFLKAIDWALKVNPHDRPQSIAQWRKALLGVEAASEATEPASTALVREDAPASRKVTGTEKLPKEPASRANARAAIFLGALAAIACVSVLLLQGPLKLKFWARPSLCEQALTDDRDAWRENSEAVKEVSARKLDVDDCRVALNLPTLEELREAAQLEEDYERTERERKVAEQERIARQEAERQRVVAERAAEAERQEQRKAKAEDEAQTANQLCNMALAGDHTEWDANPSYSRYVAEAQRRGLGISDCRLALNLPAESAPRAPEPTNDPLASVRALSNSDLCQQALNSDKNRWDSNPSYAPHIQIARERSLDVSGCLAALGINLKVAFTLNNRTNSKVFVKFFDREGRAQVDPVAGRHYIVSDGATASYRVACQKEQFICYGVSMGEEALSPFWGAGWTGEQSCADCCLSCVPAANTSKTLNVSESRTPSPNVTAKIIDNTSTNLSVAFYAQHRHNGWPAWDQNWTVAGGENTYNLRCVRGEKICYGAWDNSNVNGPYWGVGPAARHGCQNCCFNCDGITHLFTLTQ